MANQLNVQVESQLVYQVHIRVNLPLVNQLRNLIIDRVDNLLHVLMVIPAVVQVASQQGIPTLSLLVPQAYIRVNLLVVDQPLSLKVIQVANQQ